MTVSLIIGGACVVAAVGLIGSLFLLSGRPDQTKVSVEDGNLVVKPVGIMGLWAVSRGVSVPLSSVTSVQVVTPQSAARDPEKPRRFWRPPGARSPGSYLPGFVCAGTYRWSGGVRELWMVGKTQEAVAIDLAGEKYSRVVAQVPDPHATVAEVQASLPA
jgi:hypothetical protein